MPAIPTTTNYGNVAAGAGMFFGGAGGVVSDLASVAGSNATAAGYEEAAGEYGAAATQAGVNATQEQAAYRFQNVQNARNLYQVGGAQIAAIAANGLKLSGSALNIYANTQQQGAITKQLTTNQGELKVVGYLQQQQADIAQQQQDLEAAKAAKAAATGGIIGSVLSGGEAVAGLALGASALGIL